MMHPLVGLTFLLSCCMPAYGQNEDYSACFGTNIEISGVNESTEFSLDADREVDIVCTDDMDCSDGFKCVSTTADPPVGAENTAALPAFCQAPATPATGVSDISIFIPSNCVCIMDLVYVIDKSGSMGTIRFNYQIRFLIDLTNSLAALPQNNYCIKYAIASFNHAGFYHLGLTFSVPTVISTLNAILAAGSGGGSNVHHGMTVGNTAFGVFGDRSYAPNVMLVTTDLIYGSTSFLTQIQAASIAVRATGTCIHAVGMNTVPSPSLVVLQTITGNPGLVTYSLQHQLNLIVNDVRNDLCGNCAPCTCPNGYTEYLGRCYIMTQSGCWFYGDHICHSIGAIFTSNLAGAMQVSNGITAPHAWYKHPSAPILINYLPFCSATNVWAPCCETRPVVCERPCLPIFVTPAQLAGLAPTGDADDGGDNRVTTPAPTPPPPPGNGNGNGNG